MSDKRYDGLVGRFRIERRPEGREHLNQRFLENNQIFTTRKLWGTSQDRGGGGMGGVKG